MFLRPVIRICFAKLLVVATIKCEQNIKFIFSYECFSLHFYPIDGNRHNSKSCCYFSSPWINWTVVTNRCYLLLLFVVTICYLLLLLLIVVICCYLLLICCYLLLLFVICCYYLLLFVIVICYLLLICCYLFSETKTETSRGTRAQRTPALPICRRCWSRTMPCMSRTNNNTIITTTQKQQHQQ